MKKSPKRLKKKTVSRSKNKPNRRNKKSEPKKQNKKSKVKSPAKSIKKVVQTKNKGKLSIETKIPELLVVANWKMNPATLDEAKMILNTTKRTIATLKKERKGNNMGIVLCPPAVFFGDMRGKVENSRNQKNNSSISFGVQNIGIGETGSFTGEVSAAISKSAGAQYSIVGHSERRAMGETNEAVALKVEAALRAELIPIICVGEAKKDEQGLFLIDFEKQIRIAVSRIKPIDIERIVFAYEPLYAIGAAQAVTAHQIYERNVLIKKILTDMYGKERAFKVKILYGGSVDASNAIDIVFNGNAGGLLIGRASIKPEEFSQLLKNLSSR